jgi:hypothetical protein
MDVSYELIFQTNLFSNWVLFWNVLFLGIGIGITVVYFTGHLPVRSRNCFTTSFFVVWSTVWLLASTIWLASTLLTAYRYHEALYNNHCEVVEGRVTVLHEQPWGGHAPGDHIMIDNAEFEINYYWSTLAYKRTIAHGGVLTDGAQVRICHLDGDILRVELAR